MSGALDILHMSKKERKKNSIRAIKNGITLDDEIGELAWAVVRQAISDIGWIQKSRSKRINSSSQYVVDRSNDSRYNIREGGLDFWFDVLNIQKGFVIKILTHYKLL